MHHKVPRAVHNCKKLYEALLQLKNVVSAHQMHLHAYAMDVFNTFHVILL